MTARIIQDRYELRSRLGRGGMGTVWLAWDRTLRRSVALKEVVLAPHGEDMAVRRERAMLEARAAARIRHPAVVDIYDAFMDDESPWIVMAYIEGTALNRRIERQILSEREIARVGREVLAGLAAVHDAQVLHRDVKPANIIVDPGDRVFLVDFGIARISGESGLTSANMLLGTVEFMAPERIDGHAVGPASDLWSLGVTLFCALEGYSPFLRDSLIETTRAVAAGRPPRFRRPGPLADAITGLLVTVPARRMEAAELGWRLDTILAGPASRPRGRDPRPREREEPKRRPGSGAGREVRRGNDVHDSGPGREVRRGNGAHDSGPGWAGEGRDGGNPLLDRPRQEAAALLGSMEPKAAGRLLDGAAEAAGAAAEVLALLPLPRAARVIDHMTPHRAARLVGAMPPSRSASILAHTDDRVMAAVLGALGIVPAAVRLVEAMTMRRACRVLGYVPPAVVAELLSATSDGRADRLLDGLSRAVRDEIARLAGGA
ncbi:protein kinase domain-containing protein [Streptosporangium sp. NBC_01756]|uniref:protein kinase domain-containing protein n=1 Tax=Streptosporangium sp. NBC_01756 TaxID=2975950 RepID=UPI002DDB6329|nr:protein kinase [Streptosporangium sp. NBC_01756]WSC88491.1 protein kinase [Streptosporangium sp. NBC_01756]